jgi:acetate CoA/acetoacetate CoA-transferase alpha subunit
MRAVSVEEAVAMIPAGASIMVGGFMGVGTPERLLDEVVRQKKSGLSVICNDAGVPGKGVGKLFDATLVSRLTASHIGLNPKAQQQMLANQINVDLIPQGTLIERIRAGGCGLGGVLTPTGVGTSVADGKRQIEVDGKPFLLETALRAQFALVHAFLADYLGNLSYALTARNFNPVMAMAADTVIVTAEHIVPVGVIAPDHVVTPAPLVDYLITNPNG